MKEISKPITVKRMEFVENLTNLINESGLPPFVIEPILKDTLSDVKYMAKKQLESDVAKYNDAIRMAQTTE